MWDLGIEIGYVKDVAEGNRGGGQVMICAGDEFSCVQCGELSGFKT